VTSLRFAAWRSSALLDPLHHPVWLGHDRWALAARAGAALEERKAADEIQLGRLPAQLPRLGFRCRQSSRRTVRVNSTNSRADANRGATIVLDSSGGSVNDSIALGRRFRSLGALTTVGTRRRQTDLVRAAVPAWFRKPYCEVECACSLLCRAGRATCRTQRNVRVHQIWMGETVPTTHAPQAILART